jgi:hypothetical protein
MNEQQPCLASRAGLNTSAGWQAIKNSALMLNWVGGCAFVRWVTCNISYTWKIDPRIHKDSRSVWSGVF